MPVYVSLLRGINVGGHKLVKMEKLRSSLETLGFESVKTYIQSGNVVFKAKKTSTQALSKKIEDKIVQDFGFPASVITRTGDEFDRIIAKNSLLKNSAIDPAKLHVLFLSESPDGAALKKIAALAITPEECRCAEREIYFYFPNGVSQSVLFKTPVDRILAVTTTMRNWKTVNTLQQMCRECQ
jgi:uncharacterized protein (DUF1697 family)